MGDQFSAAGIGQLSEPPAVVPKKRVLWKWSLAATLFIATIFLWRCGAGLIQGRELSDIGVQQFHASLNSGKYDEIYDQATDEFRNAGPKSDSIKLFRAIHTKLGTAGSHTLKKLNVTATLTGTYLTVVYTTNFTAGEATETFTWVRKEGAVVLHGYNIQSMKLLTN